MPRKVQQQIIDKKLKFYVIDGYTVAKDTGMGSRVNTIMQTCFFAISGVLPKEEAIAAIKHSIEKTYGKRGESVVAKNFAAVDAALAHLHEVKVPAVGHQQQGSPARRSGCRLRSLYRTCWPHDSGQRRRSAGERSSGRRHLPHRHGHSGKSETSRWKFRSGTRSSASSAASACWFARTPSFAPRFMTARC